MKTQSSKFGVFGSLKENSMTDREKSVSVTKEHSIGGMPSTRQTTMLSATPENAIANEFSMEVAPLFQHSTMSDDANNILYESQVRG